MKQSRVRKLQKEGWIKFLSTLSEDKTPELYKVIKLIIK